MTCQTKAEQYAKSAEYYAAHRAEIAAQRKVTRAANRVARMAKQKEYVDTHQEERRAYRTANRAEIAAKSKVSKAEDRARIAAVQKAYRTANRQEIATKKKAYAKKIATRLRLKAANRRVRKAGNGGTHTAAEWRALCAWFGNVCLRCGASGKLSCDHVIPITKGGSNNISNLQPLCLPCNSGKRDKTIDYRDPIRLGAFLAQL